MEYTNSKARAINGVVSHPVINQEGKIAYQEGIDPNTNLLLMTNGIQFKPVLERPSKEDARNAITYLYDTFFNEISFAETPSDSHVSYKLNFLLAIAVLLTSFIRKQIDIAPGFVITANTQGTGKTTLARIIHLLLTGHDMTVHSLGGSPEETEKQFLALLSTSPGIVCFDNQFDGSEIKNVTLSRVITSLIFTGRILGKTQEMTVPTHTVFIITGNNLTISSDLLRRFFCLSLQSNEERPENRIYEVRDVKEHCIAYRTDAVQACLTIIKAYISNGAPYKDQKVKMSGFPLWDHMVRFPIMWATGVDILDAMELSRGESDEQMAKAGILEGIFYLYDENEFNARELFNRLRTSRFQHSDDALDLIEDLSYNFSQIAKQALEKERSFVYVLRN